MAFLIAIIGLDLPRARYASLHMMDVATVRKRLDAERKATLARIEAMTDDHSGIVESSLNSNADDEHDPEGSTIAFERAQVVSLIADAQAVLGELDQAFERLATGDYWSCVQCGSSIGEERLSARPTARTCIFCATSPTSR